MIDSNFFKIMFIEILGIIFLISGILLINKYKLPFKKIIVVIFVSIFLTFVSIAYKSEYQKYEGIWFKEGYAQGFPIGFIITVHNDYKDEYKTVNQNDVSDNSGQNIKISNVGLIIESLICFSVDALFWLTVSLFVYILYNKFIIKTDK
jgi:hypothetical protein